jgi:hypothetical protein
MFRQVLLAAALAVAATGAARAATLDFTFSFTNTGNGGGTVTGIVRGLQDNATRAASSVEVTGNTLGFGIGEYVGNPQSNTFTVSRGAITSALFGSIGTLNSAPAVTGSSLGLELTDQFSFAGLRDSTQGTVVTRDTGLTFTRVDVTPIPVPAALPLLLGGLGAMALFRRRGQRRAAVPA